MTYRETLDWMFAQLPMYQAKGGNAINAKLDNILQLSAHLGHPEKRFKSIHVAGTNGKGSSSHMLASVLQEAGYNVGLYTSPHLKDFRERIKINGEMVSQDFVTSFIETHRLYFESNQLSFFEMTVGMAFQFFAQEKVDIAIIEVGLGGRLDSTNIITPEVALITNIGLDHTDILGDTLEKIAFEKAGIIKTKVPVVISEYQNEIAHVFKEVADRNDAPLFFASHEKIKTYTTSLLGDYQTHNVKGVVVALSKLKGFTVTEEHIVGGLKKVTQHTGLMGRWQVLQEQPKVVCDTAHNTEGLSIILSQLKKEPYKHLHLVLGFVKEKKITEILKMFPKEATYYFCTPNIPRGLAVEVLLEQAYNADLQGKKYASVQEAYKAALKAAEPADFVYVGGSTFVVAEVL